MTSSAQPGDIELRRGRRAAPWTDTPDWVGLSPLVEPPAHSLYVKLKMHLNVKRGEVEARPGRYSLAELMGYDKVDTLDRYVDQLDAIGAIDVERRGMPARCYYTVNDLPAEWYCKVSGYVLRDSSDRCAAHAGQDEPCVGQRYAGPVTIGQWYDEHRDRIDARKTAAKAKRDRQRAKAAARKTQAKADTPANGYQAEPDTAGPPDTPYSGYQDTPPGGYQDTPYKGDLDTPPTGAEQGCTSEQGRAEQSRSEQGNSPASPPTGGAAGDQAQEGEVDGQTDNPNATAVELLDAVILDGIGPARRPRGKVRARIVAGLVDLLAAGWTPRPLGATLGGSWEGAGHIGAVLDQRVRDLLEAPVPAPPAALAAPAGPREPCPRADCDSHHGGTGMVPSATDPNAVAPCPHCRPSRRPALPVAAS